MVGRGYGWDLEGELVEGSVMASLDGGDAGGVCITADGADGGETFREVGMVEEEDCRRESLSYPSLSGDEEPSPPDQKIWLSNTSASLGGVSGLDSRS